VPHRASGDAGWEMVSSKGPSQPSRNEPATSGYEGRLAMMQGLSPPQ
jgi:hypothetical protein